MTQEEFVEELKIRLDNPAVSDSELDRYITAAKRNVKRANYSNDDYIEQILDEACQKLAIDGKFPEIQSVTVGGQSTSFSANDPKRFSDRLAGRRAAMLIGKGAGY